MCVCAISTDLSIKSDEKYVSQTRFATQVGTLMRTKNKKKKQKQEENNHFLYAFYQTQPAKYLTLAF